MKFRTLSLLAAMVLLAITALTQNYPQKLATATVPFDFVAGDVQMPAGTYTFRQINPEVIQIQSKDGHNSAKLAPSSLKWQKGENGGKVVFKRYGKEYFLSEIWSSDDKLGRELPVTKRKRTMLAGRPSAQAQNVSLVAR